MKTAILAGGLGTRLMEETTLRPKPMVEIGGRPILRHLMHFYANQGYNDFVVAAGYKADHIKDYFRNLRLMAGDLRIEMATGNVEVASRANLDWNVRIVDTGELTMTGGRLLRLKPDLGTETFMLTYGDGLSDVDIDALIGLHRSHGKIATLTAVRPPTAQRTLALDGERVASIHSDDGLDTYINGGFFVFEPGIFDYLSADSDSLEQDALPRVAADGGLMAYHHDGFWQCMDTVQERDILEGLWNAGRAPWLRAGRTAETNKDNSRFSNGALAG